MYTLSATEYQEYLMLKELAYKDELTGCWNRRGMSVLLERMAATSLLTIVFIDIRGLHNFNKVEGHLAGDGLIRFIASLVRKEDTVRWGGDEFLSICLDYLPVDVITKRMSEMDSRVIQEYGPQVGIHWGHSYGRKEDFSEVMVEAEKVMLAGKPVEVRL